MPIGEELHDADALVRRISTLERKYQKRAVKKCLRKGANVIKKDAKQRAKKFDDPKTPAKVWKEITVRGNTKAGKRVGGAVMEVGIKGGAKRYASNAKNRRLDRVGARYEGPGAVYYWRFLEFGHQARDGSWVPAQPFLRPAMESKHQEAMVVTVRALRKELRKLVDGVA